MNNLIKKYFAHEPVDPNKQYNSGLFYPDSVTAGVFHAGGWQPDNWCKPEWVDGEHYQRLMAWKPEWWRCDTCARVNDSVRVKSCPHCGAQMPVRYDK